MPGIEDRIAALEQQVQQLLANRRVAGVSVTPPLPLGAVERGLDTETYQARAARGPLGAAGAPAAAPFTIDVRFQGGLNQAQKAAFKAAADRWTRVITGALPAVSVDNEITTGVIILAQGAPIDGVGGILGQAGPTRLRPANAGAAAFLPAKGEMTFDTADLANMEQNGTLGDVITHEMGHVIGVGTVWDLRNVLQGAGTSNPTFTGQNAMREYGLMKGLGPTLVPVEHLGGQGTADSHWRDSIFKNELMTGFVNPTGGNPLSKLTVASMADLGYQVDLNAAEPYNLPNVALLAEAGILGPAPGAVDMHAVLPIIPMVLPPAALR
jgi:hypothetical protein